MIDFSIEQLNALKQNKPIVEVSKYSTPIIYLDTCLLIEFSKYKNGRCDNTYKKDIADLYELLISLMKSNRIVCVLGNQMIEMGSTQNREGARNFLREFTNASFVEPFEIEDMQIHYGYDAFINGKNKIKFSSADIFERPHDFRGSIIKAYTAFIYTPQKAKKLRQGKEKLAFSLNDGTN